MILFKTIRWKNFLSTGNQFTEVDFTKNATNLIIGSNGAGKSTILDALTFSLFGKPFRKINKPQLINSVNDKECRVEVEFDISNTSWKVVRGIKPNIFEIYRDDSLLDQSSAALDQQKWLEQNVLKMNYKSFTQIVILGSSTFVPFMQLPASHRREVIEDLLDIKIFSSMNTVTGATEKLRKLGNLKGKISQKVSTITKEHKFFTENTVCPTCTQEIDETFRINRINDAQNKAKELQSGYKELEEAIKEEEERERQFLALSKEITKLTNEISQNNIKITGCQRQIRDLESEIQTITTQLENRNSEHEKLENFRNNLQTTYEELASKKDSVNYYDFTYSLLKDGGVKTKIIKKYLPLINQQVNRYLQMMDFYINFTLDEEFNETVQSPIHEDFSYASFSEGEKMRIDLALLFTWREVARFKNSVNTNLLIMDEVFDSSLDGFGTEEFLKIICYVIKNANIFVISHKTGLEDKFESVIKFEKVKGFSRMVV
jgi:DNA repair exonuclease SbcCD ATPase subunit